MAGGGCQEQLGPAGTDVKGGRSCPCSLWLCRELGSGLAAVGVAGDLGLLLQPPLIPFLSLCFPPQLPVADPPVGPFPFPNPDTRAQDFVPGAGNKAPLLGLWGCLLPWGIPGEPGWDGLLGPLAINPIPATPVGGHVPQTPFPE